MNALVIHTRAQEGHIPGRFVSTWRVTRDVRAGRAPTQHLGRDSRANGKSGLPVTLYRHDEEADHPSSRRTPDWHELPRLWQATRKYEPTWRRRCVEATGDLRRDRVAELNLVGFSRKAGAVSDCGTPEHRGGLPCDTRLCEDCVAARATALRAVAASAINTMDHVLRVQLALPVGDLGFRGAWAWTRRGLTNLHLWLRPKGVRCFGVVFADLPKETVNADLLLEVEDLSAAEIASRWSHVTFGRGILRSFERPGTIDPPRLAETLVRARRWSPAPGTVPGSTLLQFWLAMRHRRWDVRWRV
jgi:hypothetical protein